MIKCCDLCADDSIKKSAIAKGDSTIIGVLSREIVTAEAWYHRSCYRDYTRPEKKSSTSTSAESKESDDNEDNYGDIESRGYEKLFYFIRFDLLENPRLMTMIELKEMLFTFMCSMGATQLTESSKKNFRRKLEVEFGDLLQFEDLLDNGKLFIIPNNLSKLSLAREVAQLSRELKNNVSSGIQEIQKTSLSLREAVRSITAEYTWPPDPSQLCESAINIPDELKAFLYTLLTGKTGNPVECAERVHRLIDSFGQDIIYGVSGGRQKPPKQVLLPYAVKTLTNNVELIQLINPCGHGIAYFQIEEMNIALCLQKMAATPSNEVSLPENIQPFVSTTQAWDNIDRLEGTLSGAGTSHRVNGIAVQARHFGPNLPAEPKTDLSKTRKRSISSLVRTRFHRITLESAVDLVHVRT